MAKKIISIIVILALAFSIFCLSGCSTTIVYDDYADDYGDYKPLDLVMNTGETLTIERSHFSDVEVEFEKYEVKVRHGSNEDIVSIQNNVITAKKNGFVEIVTFLFENKSNDKRIINAFGVYTGRIHVINEATMIPITTAQELQDMSLDLAGNYILNADIDLEGIDWQPIGMPSNSFTGMFINPQGFAIKNLTITSSEKINSIRSDQAGFFGATNHAFIDGLILENVFIDITDSTKTLPTAGGIVAEAWNSFFYNCKVDGKIYSKIWAGGLAGYDQYGTYRNCEFNGIVEALDSAGGIVGYHYAHLKTGNFFNRPFIDEGVFSCTVKADIVAAYAGGIVGYNEGDSKPLNCTFTGTLFGKQGQDEICGYNRW